MDHKQLRENATAVLKANDRGTHTIPSPRLYPHQWLWDSCFIAIGLRHMDTKRARQEILSLLDGQWHNGMVPHCIMGSERRYRNDHNLWRSWLNPNSPDNVHTSGITQPPMLAEAIYQIGQKLTEAERHLWYKKVLPRLTGYHQWLYNERDPHNEGLTLQIHPWETGLDNTPPWMSELHKHQMPVWIRLIARTKTDKLLSLLRRDARYTVAGERLTTVEALALFSIQRRLRRKRYDIETILNHSLFAIEDAAFNAILIRANSLLKHIAKTLHTDLEPALLDSMARTEAAYEQLWDPESSQYYSRNFITHSLINESSIATLLPLYGGSITQERADQLVKLLTDEKKFASPYPIPSTPLDSNWFNPLRYWQGPVWASTNWLVIEGLKRYGYDELAVAITNRTLEMVSGSGFYEYYVPLDGRPLGGGSFSWTAALTIDWLNEQL